LTTDPISLKDSDLTADPDASLRLQAVQVTVSRAVEREPTGIRGLPDNGYSILDIIPDNLTGLKLLALEFRGERFLTKFTRSPDNDYALIRCEEFDELRTQLDNLCLLKTDGSAKSNGPVYRTEAICYSDAALSGNRHVTKSSQAFEQNANLQNQMARPC
jgi:hypothetical protein